MKKYLINPRKPKGAAHIMRDGDTACRMLSTGGLPGGAAGYTTVGDPQGRRICHMCQRVVGFHTTKPAVTAQIEPPDTDMTEAERRALKLLVGTDASVSYGLTVYAMLRRRGYAALRDGDRRGKRYFITEAGLAAHQKETV